MDSSRSDVDGIRVLLGFQVNMKLQKEVSILVTKNKKLGGQVQVLVKAVKKQQLDAKTKSDEAEAARAQEKQTAAAGATHSNIAWPRLRCGLTCDYPTFSQSSRGRDPSCCRTAESSVTAVVTQDGNRVPSTCCASGGRATRPHQHHRVH